MIIDELNKKISDIENLANDKTGSLESKVNDLTDGILMVADAVDTIPEMVDEKLAVVTKEITAVKEQVKKVKTIKGDKGEPGTRGEPGMDGIDGIDGSPDSGKDIAGKLNKLEDVLDPKIIKGSSEYVNKTDLNKTISTLENQTRFLIQANQNNSNSGGLTSVTTDSTMTGNGTTASPLSVVATSASDVAVTVRAATTAALAGTWTYNNGTSGVGATLTRTTNGALPNQDGVSLMDGDRFLIKNQASTLVNGVYVLTQKGVTSVSPTIFTRATDADETSELDELVVTVSEGSTNRGTVWGQQTNNPVVGTSAIVFATVVSTAVTQATSGTQAINQIPLYTGTARQLTRGTANFKYNPTNNLFTIRGIDYTFPANNGDASQVLTTDGSGNLSWTSAGGGSSFITKTKAEIDALITANGLVAGALYEITGVHPTLYDDGTTSGTTIYLRAISGNQLEVQGMGKFFNPKYNKSVDGFGIWDNKMYGTLSNVVGVFDYLNKELVTADNSATGLILADGMIQWVSGDWSAAVSITGSVSGATADVVDFVTPSYSIANKVIWGGYSWTNVNGNVGASTDVLNLDSEWTKNTYDTTNYNVAYDVIEYDYANDFIVRRYNEEANIDIKCSKPQYDFFVGINGLSFHAISVQQWGNNYDLLTYKGQLNIICNGGYNESVNFSGSSQANLTFGNNSYQYNLTFGNSSGQYNLTFGSGSYQYNLTFGISSYQSYITFGSGSSQDNLTFGDGSRQQNLTFGSDSYQYNLTFGSSSYQQNLTFGISSYQQNLTFGSGSSQDNLTFGDGSSQQNLTFGSSSFQSSLTFGSGSQLNYSSQVISSNMQYITFNTKNVTVPDLSAATLIFDGNIKEVYQRPNGALKIRYYDNSDALVIADIAD